MQVSARGLVPNSLARTWRRTSASSCSSPRNCVWRTRASCFVALKRRRRCAAAVASEAPWVPSWAVDAGRAAAGAAGALGRSGGRGCAVGPAGRIRRGRASRVQRRARSDPRRGRGDRRHLQAAHQLHRGERRLVRPGAALHRQVDEHAPGERLHDAGCLAHLLPRLGHVLPARHLLRRRVVPRHLRSPRLYRHRQGTRVVRHRRVPHVARRILRRSPSTNLARRTYRGRASSTAGSSSRQRARVGRERREGGEGDVESRDGAAARTVHTNIFGEGEESLDRAALTRVFQALVVRSADVLFR